MDVDLYDDCPGFALATRREQEIRAIPFLGLPEYILGLEVRPMSLRHYTTLSLLASPFLLPVEALTLAAKPGIADDINKFLWVISPFFKAGVVPGGKWRRRVDRLTFRLFENRRDRFNRKYSSIITQRLDIVCDALLDYVQQAWMDAGTGGGGGRSYHGAAGSMVAILSKHFNITRAEAFDMPLKIAWQYTRIAQQWENPNAPLENKLSDACIEQWMKSLQPKK